MKTVLRVSLLLLLTLTLSACKKSASTDNTGGGGTENLNSKVMFEVLIIEPSVLPDKVNAKFKVTNLGKKPIIRAHAKVYVLDDAGKELGMEEHWVIKASP